MSQDSNDPKLQSADSQPAEERNDKNFSRRALIQAGWAIPVVIAAQMPKNAMAASPSHGDHADVPHNDVPHNDVPHNDVPHNDVPHNDVHNDVPHNDTNYIPAHSQGYWKNHASAWPLSGMLLGSHFYTKAEALAIMGTPVKGDRSIALAYQLIAAKLNVAAGANPAISSTIAAADVLLSGYAGRIPLGSAVSSTDKALMTTLADALEAYNTP